MSSETSEGDELLKVGPLEPISDIYQRLLGTRLSSTTEWRQRKGIRGIKLPAKFAGGCWRSTEAAVNWFIDAQTAERTGGDTSPDDDAERDDATTRRLQAAGLL